jgi:hypothetical protein
MIVKKAQTTALSAGLFAAGQRDAGGVARFGKCFHKMGTIGPIRETSI